MTSTTLEKYSTLHPGNTLNLAYTSEKSSPDSEIDSLMDTL